MRGGWHAADGAELALAGRGETAAGPSRGGGRGAGALDGQGAPWQARGIAHLPAGARCPRGVVVGPARAAGAHGVPALRRGRAWPGQPGLRGAGTVPPRRPRCWPAAVATVTVLADAARRPVPGRDLDRDRPRPRCPSRTACGRCGPTARARRRQWPGDRHPPRLDSPDRQARRPAPGACRPSGPWVGKRVRGPPAEAVAAELQARTAQQLFSVLGELKGGAMKVGQALSVMEAAIPEQFAGRTAKRSPSCRRTGPRWAPTGCTILARSSGHWPGPSSRVRRQAGGLGQHRPGAQGGVARRTRSRREDPVPRRRRGPARRPEPALAVHPGWRGRGCPASTSSRSWKSSRPGSARSSTTTSRLATSGTSRRPSATTTTCSCPTCSSTPTTCSSASGSRARRCRTSSRPAPAVRDDAAPLYLEFLLARRSGPGLLHADPHPGNFRLSRRPAGRHRLGAVNRLPDGLPPAMARGLTLALDAEPRPRAGLRRGGLHPQGRRDRPRGPARLPHPARRAAARGGVHLLARLAARRRGEDPGPSPAAVPRRPEAQPAAGVPADPPGLARWDRGAQPDRWHGAAARDGLRAPARHRRVTPASPAPLTDRAATSCDLPAVSRRRRRQNRR